MCQAFTMSNLRTQAFCYRWPRRASYSCARTGPKPKHFLPPPSYPPKIVSRAPSPFRTAMILRRLGTLIPVNLAARMVRSLGVAGSPGSSISQDHLPEGGVAWLLEPLTATNESATAMMRTSLVSGLDILTNGGVAGRRTYQEPDVLSVQGTCHSPPESRRIILSPSTARARTQPATTDQ
jgi:hypothetical protein